MAVGDFWPTLRYREMILDGTIAPDLNSQTIHIALMKASLTAYVDNTHLADLSYYGSITAEEALIDGNAGGKALTSCSITLSTSFVVFKHGDASTFVASSTTTGDTARWAIVFHNTGTPATSPIIGILDLGSARALTGGANSTPLSIYFTNLKILKFSGTGTPALT